MHGARAAQGSTKLTPSVAQVLPNGAEAVKQVASLTSAAGSALGSHPATAAVPPR